MSEFSEPGSWHWAALVALGLVLAVHVAHRIARPLVLRLAALSPLLTAVLRRCDRPLQWLLPLVALQLLWQSLPEERTALHTVQHVNGVLLIVVATWLLSAAIRGLADGVIAAHPAEVEDNLQARRIQTQTRVLSRIATSAVLIAGLAFVLMTFPRARQFGASLLASAGVAGLVIGLAARSVFGNLLAGLQIALAQPIRLDDVLIVEGEWGRVEEITSTYVVLRLWDERRLVVPLQWFVEHPFQNWTRRSANILGTVFLWVDFGLPLQPLRDEVKRVCADSPQWDGRVCIVQVTDAGERAMQLRVLLSSASSGQNFDLRCQVREALIAYLQREHPGSLPRVRTETATPPSAPAGAVQVQEDMA